MEMTDNNVIIRNYKEEDLPLTYPENTTKVSFFPLTNQQYPSNLPPTIKKLYLGWHYDCPLITPLPTTITHLSFNGPYNHPLSIPSHITHLFLELTTNSVHLSDMLQTLSISRAEILIIPPTLQLMKLTIYFTKSNHIVTKLLQSHIPYYLLSYNYYYYDNKQYDLTANMNNRTSINRYNTYIKQRPFYELSDNA